jgi:hypothetical protein
MPSWAKARHLAAVIAANGGGLDLTPEQIAAEKAQRAKIRRELRAIIDNANIMLYCDSDACTHPTHYVCDGCADAGSVSRAQAEAVIAWANKGHDR